LRRATAETIVAGSSVSPLNARVAAL
jgi:hypothetical protein